MAHMLQHLLPIPLFLFDYRRKNVKSLNWIMHVIWVIRCMSSGETQSK